MLRSIAITLVFGALGACVSTPDAPDTSSPPNERDAALDASISEDVARVEASARCEHPLGCLAFRSPGDFLLPGETEIGRAHV